MKPISVTEPFEILVVDILGPLLLSIKGNKYIVVFIEYLTRWTEAFAIPDAKAETVARVLVEEIVCRFGSLQKLIGQRHKLFVAHDC